jgi:hypothetical protein
MDSFKKGLHSHKEAGAKTDLAVCHSEIKHQTLLSKVVNF